jgi:hypothetical protein
MSNATAALGRLLGQQLFKCRQLALATHQMDLATIRHRDARRIIAAVFEAMQST